MSLEVKKVMDESQLSFTVIDLLDQLAFTCLAHLLYIYNIICGRVLLSVYMYIRMFNQEYSWFNIL